MEPCKTFWGWKHKWGKWVEESRGDSVVKNAWESEWRKNGKYIYQERECEVCGLKEIRKQEFSNDI